MKSEKSQNHYEKTQEEVRDIFKYLREILNRKRPSMRSYQSFLDYKTQNSEGYSKIKLILYFPPILFYNVDFIFGIHDFNEKQIFPKR